jgi:glycosyltransferase involved in cell wall biosynthesis
VRASHQADGCRILQVKVLIAHNRYRSEFPSGEDRVVDTEAAALRGAGHTVTHFERRSDDIANWPRLRRAALPLSVIWSRSARQELQAAIRRDRPDVIHVHNTFPLLTASVLAAGTEARVPIVVTIHNYKLSCASGDFFRAGTVCHDCAGRLGLPGIVHGCYRGSRLTTAPVVAGTVLNRQSWRTRPSAYIFISESQRRAMESMNLPLSRSFVKWNLVPRTPAGATHDEGRVSYLGRLDQAKGLSVLMDGWDCYLGRSGDANLRLSIAGNGPLMPVIREWAGGRESVDLLGVLDRDGCRDLIARSRAVVVPSAWEETFGLVVVEAMAGGVPVIAARHGSLPELVSDGLNGALFGPGDPGDLSSVLEGVAADPDRWRQLGAAARRTYEAQWDPEANLAQLIDIYRFAIENPVWLDRS